MNLSKTKWMRNQFCPDAEVTVDEHTIEEVKEYVYLGHQISFENNFAGECSRRRKAAWNSFNKIRTLLLDDNLTMATKVALFNSMVLPAMLYGAECWPTTKSEEEKLAITQRAMERRMCKVSLRDHISSAEIRRRTKCVDIVQALYNKKRDWAGHVQNV